MIRPIYILVETWTNKIFLPRVEESPSHSWRAITSNQSHCNVCSLLWNCSQYNFFLQGRRSNNYCKWGMNWSSGTACMRNSEANSDASVLISGFSDIQLPARSPDLSSAAQWVHDPLLQTSINWKELSLVTKRLGVEFPNWLLATCHKLKGCSLSLSWSPLGPDGQEKESWDLLLYDLLDVIHTESLICWTWVVVDIRFLLRECHLPKSRN